MLSVGVWVEGQFPYVNSDRDGFYSVFIQAAVDFVGHGGLFFIQVDGVLVLYNCVLLKVMSVFTSHSEVWDFGFTRALCNAEITDLISLVSYLEAHGCGKHGI